MQAAADGHARHAARCRMSVAPLVTLRPMRRRDLPVSLAARLVTASGQARGHAWPAAVLASGWNSPIVLPSGPRTYADQPMPGTGTGERNLPPVMPARLSACARMSVPPFPRKPQWAPLSSISNSAIIINCNLGIRHQALSKSIAGTSNSGSQHE
jgi:hypothetical protein